ncbi:hypothetical protein [Cyanobium sp. Copco_Reservoir_LC18]|uniref:hypothetical protein n=1 Tax=Cyanobium sp. Copco_Reservoir_LC18 TaxID=1328305 RepID=UPI0013571C19|nr:hypothetical protein [Cyanobium sp. Copco_Reservoir_LC18]
MLSYSEGGLKVITSQPCDEPGSVEVDSGSTLIFPPTEAGREIHVEGETPQELEANLFQDGYFTEEEAKQIMSMTNLSNM